MISLHKKRVFYVEDDVNNRAIVQIILERFGAKVGFERWGGEAIVRIKAFMPVDVILLDLMFPQNVTGYDVIDAIRTEPGLADIPIVAVSASDPAIEVPKARKKGFVGFISKPVDMRWFPEQVAKILDGKQVWPTDRDLPIDGSPFETNAR